MSLSPSESALETWCSTRCIGFFFIIITLSDGRRLIWLQRKPSRTARSAAYYAPRASEAHESRRHTYARHVTRVRDRRCLRAVYGGIVLHANTYSHAFEIHSPAWQRRDQWRRCTRTEEYKVVNAWPSKVSPRDADIVRAQKSGEILSASEILRIPLTRVSDSDSKSFPPAFTLGDV